MSINIPKIGTLAGLAVSGAMRHPGIKSIRYKACKFDLAKLEGGPMVQQGQSTLKEKLAHAKINWGKPDNMFGDAFKQSLDNSGDRTLKAFKENRSRASRSLDKSDASRRADAERNRLLQMMNRKAN